MEKSITRRGGRAVAALGLALLMTIPLHPRADAHPVGQFWKFDPDVRSHTWRAHPALRRRHDRWHRRNPNATAREHHAFHHRLIHADRRRHRHRVVGTQRGRASYYSGRIGGCGVPLTGLYAAHRHWPCGTKVSVRRGRRYVMVRVLDRGPFAHGRVIDLSRSAFARIGPTSAGVLDVSIHRLSR